MLKLLFALFAVLALFVGGLDARPMKPKLNGKTKLEQLQQEAKAIKRIVDGTPAAPGRYPYMVGLFFGFPRPFCGGTLIAPSLVLTAAHCSGSETVSVGCLGTNPDLEPGCEAFNVAQEFLFPGSETNQLGIPILDWSVLVLDGASVNTPLAYLAAPGLTLPAGTKVNIVGWGDTFTGEQYGSPILLEAEVESIPNEVCNQKYFTVLQQDTVDETMICSASPGSSVCNGDSGGPMLVACEATGEDLEVGITSWGIGCASPQYPGVFARVSFGLDFILGVMAQFGESIDTISSLDDFCLVGGTKAPTAPTPPPTAFPTFPTAWTCNPGFYGTFDGCDCNCGAPDPDCDVELPEQDIFGCDSIENCIEGVCTTPPAAFPTFSPIPAPPPVPDEWTCPPSFYASLDGCDCECGAPDPDCEVPGQGIFGCDSVENCVEGVCISNTLSPSIDPTVAQTDFPTSSPTNSPTSSPTKSPSVTITAAPTDGGAGGGGDVDMGELLIVLVLFVIALALVVLVLVLMLRSRRRAAAAANVSKKTHYQTGAALVGDGPAGKLM